MARYHFNPATGIAGVCKAKAGNCPFLLEGSRHYDTVRDARAGAELFFTEGYTSLSARLAVQRSRIQREIIQRDAAGEDTLTLYPLIDERRAIDARIQGLEPYAHEVTKPFKGKPEKLVFGELNKDLGDRIVGIHNQIEGLEAASKETFDASFKVSEDWVSRLTTRETQVLLDYSQNTKIAASERELFEEAIRKAPPLVPTKVYSGLSEHVGNDVRRQLSSGYVDLAYPISTSLNAAQVNGFMEVADDGKVAVEIETTTGGSMLALSYSPHEFEVLLPSGSYEVLEIRNTVKMLWAEDGAGRTADIFVKLRRVS